MKRSVTCRSAASFQLFVDGIAFAGTCPGKPVALLHRLRFDDLAQVLLAIHIETEIFVNNIVLTPVVAVLLSVNSQAEENIDNQLISVLTAAGFTGRIESTLERRLGRSIESKLADLGRLLWFDTAGGLHSDNTCGGCHSPASGFGDSQSIAIGVQNNNIVGRNRTGPRNQRRTPSISIPK